MGTINKYSNIYDKSGNLVRKVQEDTGRLKRYSLEETETLVDDLTKKVQEDPNNIEYANALKNAQAVLFNMYNSMSREQLAERLTILQDAIQSAKSEANDTESAALDHANAKLEELKEAYDKSNETAENEYVQFTEIPKE